MNHTAIDIILALGMCVFALMWYWLLKQSVGLELKIDELEDKLSDFQQVDFVSQAKPTGVCNHFIKFKHIKHVRNSNTAS